MIAVIANIYLHLPIMVILISMVYSATRYDRWQDIRKEAIQWALKMTVFLLVIGVALLIIDWWI